jgi:hypothetical protein
MRQLVCLALLFLAAPGQAKDTPASTSQFLDKSWVTVPKQVGDFVLDYNSYDPASVASGVSLGYRTAEIRAGSALNIFVFPQGRSAQEDGLKRALADITDGVLAAQKTGRYENVVFGDVEDFTVAAAPATVLADAGKAGRSQPVIFKGMPAGAPTTPATQPISDDPVATAMAASNAPTSTVGRKLRIAFSHDGTRERSLGYAFYRNLFLITVRYSAPIEFMSAEQFEALGDKAARALVPAIDIQNFGRCGTMSIDMTDTPANDNGQAAAPALIREMGRIEAENCAASEGDHPPALPADHERQVLIYPPGTWK